MPRATKLRKKAKYSDEFKAQAVELSNHPEIPVKDVAEALDIHPFMLSRWKKEYREGKIVVDKRKKKPIIDESSLSEKKHIRQLERENQKLRIENDLLKKTIQFNLEKKKKSSNLLSGTKTNIL